MEPHSSIAAILCIHAYSSAVWCARGLSCQEQRSVKPESHAAFLRTNNLYILLRQAGIFFQRLLHVLLLGGFLLVSLRSFRVSQPIGNVITSSNATASFVERAIPSAPGGRPLLVGCLRGAATGTRRLHVQRATHREDRATPEHHFHLHRARLRRALVPRILAAGVRERYRPMPVPQVRDTASYGGSLGLVR